MLRELHALGSQAVEVGRFDLLLSKAAEFAIAQIIGEEEHDIGLFRV
jgi:hypothetical protein